MNLAIQSQLDFATPLSLTTPNHFSLTARNGRPVIVPYASDDWTAYEIDPTTAAVQASTTFVTAGQATSFAVLGGNSTVIWGTEAGLVIRAPWTDPDSAFEYFQAQQQAAVGQFVDVYGLYTDGTDLWALHAVNAVIGRFPLTALDGAAGEDVIAAEEWDISAAVGINDQVAGFCPAPGGWLMCARQLNGTLYRFDTDWQLVETISVTGAGHLYGIVARPDGGYWATDEGGTLYHLAEPATPARSRQNSISISLGL